MAGTGLDHHTAHRDHHFDATQYHRIHPGRGPDHQPMNPAIHILIFILFISGLLGAGRLILNMLTPARRRKHTLDELPLAFILGAAAVSIITLPLSIAGITTQLWMLLVIAGTILIARKMFPSKHERKNDLSLFPYELIALGAFAFLLLMNFLITITTPQFDIDMIGHILMKAQIVAGGSYANAVYLHDPVFATANNNYPPLTVFLHAFMILLGLNTTADYQAVNYILVFFLGLTLHATLRTRIHAAQSLAWCFVLISTGEYLNSQFLISSTDILLALAILVIARTFLDNNEDAGHSHNILIAVLCACALLIKNDAIIFTGLITAGLWIRQRRFPGRHLLIMTGLLGPWLIYRTTLPDPATGSEHMLKHIQDYLLPANIPYLIQTITSVLTRNLYGIFLILPVVCLFLRKNKDVQILTACVMITLLAYIIMIWGMIPLGIKYETPGLMRLWSQVYPLTLLITALTLNAGRSPR